MIIAFDTWFCWENSLKHVKNVHSGQNSPLEGWSFQFRDWDTNSEQGVANTELIIIQK